MSEGREDRPVSGPGVRWTPTELTQEQQVRGRPQPRCPRALARSVGSLQRCWGARTS